LGLRVRSNARRLLEWLLVALLVLVLIGAFVHYSRSVQIQAELSAIKSTVGALRVALVVDHLKQQAAALKTVSDARVNPFQLLGRVPGNYVGEVTLSQSSLVPPGGWVFAPDCVCVGYRPQDASALDGAPVDGLVWFEVRRNHGLLQLFPKENYQIYGVPVE